MTLKQAEKMAAARWGRRAAIQFYGGKDGHLAGKKMVGFVSLGMFFEVRGMGLTWEQAFADADAKAGAPR